jgi:nucleoside-diphosphate-sugar epimerase
MKVLIIGGTGLISRGVVKHLLTRGAEVTMYNRAQRENPLPPKVKLITGDRTRRSEFEATFSGSRFDVVIDMICFHPDDAESDVRAFGGRCEQLQFCSSVAAYGVKISDQVLVDESFPADPVSPYGKGKLACEQIFLRADEARAFRTTILRPANTYGPGRSMVDQLEIDSVAWDRVERGLPVICADGGMTLWQSTHVDDCGKAFAYSALNPKTYGETYNATRDRVFTWRDYYREMGVAVGKPVELFTMPASWIIRHSPQRFFYLRDISRFHSAYSSAKAKRDIPEFRCTVDFPEGARETIEDLHRRNALRDSRSDDLYLRMADEAVKVGDRIEFREPFPP